MAARFIYEKQQRLATQAEIAVHNEQQRSANMAALIEARTRAGFTTYVLPEQKARRNG